MNLRGEIVEDADVMSSRDQRIRQVRANKSRSASNQNFLFCHLPEFTFQCLQLIASPKVQQDLPELCCPTSPDVLPLWHSELPPIQRIPQRCLYPSAGSCNEAQCPNALE